MTNVNELKKLLKEAGLKATPARVAIFLIFKKAKEPISSDQVFRRLREIKIDLATVYRVIKVFCQKGIIKRVDLRRNSVFYELSEKHQHHIVCVGCGQTERLEGCLISENKYKEIISKSEKFKHLRDHSLELFGVCGRCSD
jgi:Fur family transcriptional regulator, ferric uptake regulator